MMEHYQHIGSIDFIEKYCLVNGKPIKLTDYQKAFCKWMESLRAVGKTITIPTRLQKRS